MYDEIELQKIRYNVILVTYSNRHYVTKIMSQTFSILAPPQSKLLATPVPSVFFTVQKK